MPENTSIDIRPGTVSISDHAFYDCTSLTSITIPDSVTNIGNSAFRGTPWFDSMPDGVVYINRVLYAYKGEMPENTSIDIRPGTVSISDGAFWGCSGLTSITIPDSLISIGSSAFVSCSRLTSITIPDSIEFIGCEAFALPFLTDIYYTGTEEEWNNIEVEDVNFFNATIHFNYAPVPPITVLLNSAPRHLPRPTAAHQGFAHVSPGTRRI